MTEKDKELLAELEVRIRQLMYHCDSLREDNIRLSAELEHKDEQLVLLEDKVIKLESNYNNLKLARSLVSGSETDSGEAKKRLNKLVREIDKCIAILKS